MSTEIPDRVGTVNARSYLRLIESEQAIGRAWLEILNKNPQSIEAASAVHDSAVRLSDRERIYAIYFHYPDAVGGVS